MVVYPLELMFPGVRRIHFPFTRDQVMLFMMAFNEIMLGVETFVAHMISRTIVPYEWIPIIFGPTAGIFLLLAGLLARRNRPLATTIATIVFLASIIVGLLGAYFHLVRAIRPAASLGNVVSIPLLIWAPPVLGPLTFALVGLLGISAAWVEDPPDSGSLVLPRGRHLQLPYNKTRAYFFIAGLGALATVISSVLDHARTDFSNPWLWFATAVGVFTTVVAVYLGAVDHPGRTDYFTYLVAMLLMILTGVLGLTLHVAQDLTTQGVFVLERFLRVAPPLAPLLFADMGVIGLIALLNPVELEDTT
jgi:hypothetical protein